VTGGRDSLEVCGAGRGGTSPQRCCRLCVCYKVLGAIVGAMMSSFRSTIATVLRGGGQRYLGSLWRGARGDEPAAVL